MAKSGAQRSYTSSGTTISIRGRDNTFVDPRRSPGMQSKESKGSAESGDMSRESVSGLRDQQKGPASSKEDWPLLAGDQPEKHKPARSAWAHLLPAIIYGLLNLSSVVTIVVANKVVMTTYKFSFPVCLTWCHSSVTALGMVAMAAAGMFQVKKLPWQKSAQVAAAYVGFIVFNNLSIQYNTVGFYQISKIMITPVVVVIEYFAYGKTVGRTKMFAIGLLMFGITVATVTDSQVSSNPLGLLVAAAAVLSSSLYQVWAGSKQKELGVNGNQLLHQVAPSAVAMLAVLIPLLEPVGSFAKQDPKTILGFQYSKGAVMWILFSSCLGLVVTLSTYLFIGATSPLTYNVVGHMKTVFIVTSGIIFFKDTITMKKFVGIACAMAGIVWYTSTGIIEKPPPPPVQSAGVDKA